MKLTKLSALKINSFLKLIVFAFIFSGLNSIAQGIDINTKDITADLLVMTDVKIPFEITRAISNPGSITGGSIVCSNTLGASYSISLIPGATAYIWTVPSDATITTGQGSAGITMNFGSVAGNVCVRAENACATSAESCLAITINTAPFAPIAGSNIPSSSQILWNWSDTSSPVSFKWSTSATFSSAANNGTNTSYSQTGLSCGSIYSLYVWAYNNCGNSFYKTLTQVTSACSCGGIISTIAGNGTGGYNGDGISATSAEINGPSSVYVDGSGNIFIAEFWGGRIRKLIFSNGLISTIAGNGTSDYNGDGIVATDAELNNPEGVVLDALGNVYIADESNSKIRKVITSTGLISTVSNTPYPAGVFVDGNQNVYITNWQHNTIDKFTISTGLTTTFAGNGSGGYNGDGILATNAKLYYPWGNIVMDNYSNVYIADYYSNRIRKVTASNGLISTLAGNGSPGYNGDGITATLAQLDEPTGVALDGAGNVYIADKFNNRIRKIITSSGIIYTIAGGGGSLGDGGPATNAQLYLPQAVFVDNSGNIYIGDTSNHRVRKVCQ